MKMICTVSCSLFAIVLLAAMALGSSLGPNEMASTIGGGNCARCPTSMNSKGSSSPCTNGSGECTETEGYDYKVCESYTHPDTQCLNDEDVTESYTKWCDDLDGDCDLSEGVMDCTCHSEANTTKGCT